MSSVYINHIDSLFGSILAAAFRSTVIGTFRTDNLNAGDEDSGSSPRSFYHVSGTSSGNHKTVDNSCISPPVDFNILQLQVLDQDIILYNICDESGQIFEAEFVVNALHKNMENFVNPKIFILISTCLTWAKTKPVDPDDPDSVFTEDDYRMRRPYPSFKDHIALEKHVLKLGRTNKSIFSTYVICSGLIYGGGESLLHFLFKRSWLSGPFGNQLPIFGNGQNYIPTINVNDIASIVVNLVEMQPKPRYILAVDDSKNTLEEIVKSISNELGNGNIQNVSREDALLIPDVDVITYDTLLVNLRMEARFVKENMHFQWICEAGLVENIKFVVSQYKKQRKLLPLKMCILGPPASGKSTLASLIANHYKIHHITIQEVIQKQIESLENLASRTRGIDEEEDNEARSEQAKDLLATLRDNYSNNSGRYDDSFIIDFLKSTLSSKRCHNQGYILDGYPKTYKQAQELYGTYSVSQLQDASVDNSLENAVNTIPGVIIQLESTEEFLRRRLICLPQNMIEGTHNTEEGFFRRFCEYQNLNSTDTTVTNFFDENEIDVIKIDIANPPDVCPRSFLKHIIDIAGSPTNYGPTSEELMLLTKQEQNRILIQDKKVRDIILTSEMEESARKCTSASIWTAQGREIKIQQQEYLQCQAMPMRNYLMKFVMPTLTKGLVSMSKIAPEDPIDFLAEYLFRNNPCLT